MNHKDMVKWLKNNKKELSNFMNINFNTHGLDWVVGYKIDYKKLTKHQQKLSDEFEKKLKLIELN